MHVGMVRAWVLTPDGHPYDMLDGAKTGPTPAGLQRAVEHFKPRPGKPVVTAGPQSAPPPAPADAVTLHLNARGNDRGSWGEFPAENWIVLTREVRNSCQGATSIRARRGNSTELSAPRS